VDDAGFWRRLATPFRIGDSRLPRADWCAEGWADVEPRRTRSRTFSAIFGSTNLPSSQRGAEAIRLSHSYRSATIGSTRDARRAGTSPDTVATAVNTTMAIANDARSAAPTVCVRETGSRRP